MAIDGRPVVIIGAGENAQIAYEYFTYDSPHDVVAFAVEAEYFVDHELEGVPVVPFEELAARYDPAKHLAFVAISSTQLNRVRMRLFHAVKAMGFTCASYVSSKAFVWRNVTIGENVFVFEANVLQHHVEVGDNVVLWSGNHIGHRTHIWADCFIASHVVISGYCTIGARSFMGVNSCVADRITVAEDCVIGAGAVILRDTEPRGVYLGNPARATGRDAFDSFGVQET